MIVASQLNINNLLKVIDKNELRKLDSSHQALDYNNLSKLFSKIYKTLDLNNHMFYTFLLELKCMDAITFQNHLTVKLLKDSIYICTGSLAQWYNLFITLKKLNYYDDGNQLSIILKAFYKINKNTFKKLWEENE